ncbi:MAG: aminopeptidase [Alkalispirochaetaceae bacterium]
MAISSIVAGRSVRILLIPMFLLIFLTGCYTVEQGYHFLKDQLRAKPLEQAVARWPQYASFFEEAESIRAFGRDELGLADTESYTRFIPLDRDYLVSVVSAVDPVSFERKFWRYPIVGPAPYKGFYREKAALRTAERLEQQGWETFVRKVGAFSSLGYFRDPLYSYMSEYHPERLASMLFHEMTHATVWIQGDVPLNEAVAVFVGDQGALEYLRQRFGSGSPSYQDALKRQAERTRFRQFMSELAVRLETLYASDSDAETKLREKRRIIADEKLRFAENYDQWFSDDSYRGFLEREVNNAYVDLYRTYNGDVELIASLYAARGESIRSVLEAFREDGDGRTYRSLLREWLAEEPQEPTTL